MGFNQPARSLIPAAVGLSPSSSTRLRLFPDLHHQVRQINGSALCRCARARQVLRVVLSPSVRVLLYRVCVVQLRQKNDKEGELVSLCELGHALGVMLLFAEAKICLRTSFSISKSLHSVPLQCWVSSTLAWVLFSEARHTLSVNGGSLDSLALSIHNRSCNEAEKLYEFTCM